VPLQAASSKQQTQPNISVLVFQKQGSASVLAAMKPNGMNLFASVQLVPCLVDDFDNYEHSQQQFELRWILSYSSPLIFSRASVS